jgi:hypothetical protein
MEKGWFVGVDLGQSQDFTAVAAVERVAEQGEWDAVQFGYPKYWTLRLRHLERMALGTPYPAMVRRVCEIVRSGDLAGRCHLVVDATGVGRPVVDLLREARPGCRILPVTITSGDAESVEGAYYRTPKRDLVTTGCRCCCSAGDCRLRRGWSMGRRYRRRCRRCG